MAELDGAMRRSRPERNVGYLLGIAIFGALWALVNQTPGWEAVPFLSSDFEQLVPMVNVALMAGAGANLTLVVYDARWFRATLGLVMAGIGVWVSLGFLRSFPFSFAAVQYDLTTPLMVAVLVSLASAAVLAIVHLVALSNAALRASEPA